MDTATKQPKPRVLDSSDEESEDGDDSDDGDDGQPAGRRAQPPPKKPSAYSGGL